MIDIKRLEVVSDGGLTGAAARKLGDGFARELALALGSRVREGLDIERLVLDAPLAQLSRPGGMREIAQGTARQLRARVWRE